MGVPLRRAAEAQRVHSLTVWVTAFAALLLQTVLPVKIPWARFFDFPLLIVIYFSLLRRSEVFGIGLGTGLGLLQDTLAHGYIGIFGMAKALIGFLAALASVKFDLDQPAPRFVFAAILIFIHNIFLFGLERVLLDPAPPFRALQMLSGILVNIALSLFLFEMLDHFKRPS